MKLQLVKFTNGSYGIRKFSFNPFLFGYMYYDMKIGSMNAWWRIDDAYFCDCSTSNMQLARDILAVLNNKVESVIQ